MKLHYICPIVLGEDRVGRVYFNIEQCIIRIKAKFSNTDYVSRR